MKPSRDRRIDFGFLSVLQRTLDGAYVKPVDDGHRAHEGALLVSDWVPCHGNDPPVNGVHDQYARGKRMVRVPTWNVFLFLLLHIRTGMVNASQTALLLLSLVAGLCW